MTKGISKEKIDYGKSSRINSIRPFCLPCFLGRKPFFPEESSFPLPWQWQEVAQCNLPSNYWNPALLEPGQQSWLHYSIQSHFITLQTSQLCFILLCWWLLFHDYLKTVNLCRQIFHQSWKLLNFKSFYQKVLSVSCSAVALWSS